MTGSEIDAIIDALELQPHPEGGWYRETYRHVPNERDDVQSDAGMSPGVTNAPGVHTSRDVLASPSVLASPDVLHSRGVVTLIYYLLRAGETSAWHRVRDAEEIWCWHRGGPLLLSIARDAESAPVDVRLGAALGAGETLQAVVPAGHWQAARPLGDFSLVSCVVAPAFEFSGFEMAPKGWAPGPAS